MGMTRLERGTRTTLARYLRNQGYVTYAGLLLKFDLNFYRTQPGETFAAAMLPNQGRILINPDIDDKEALSMLIRHEILHEYLKHYNRLMKHLAAQANLDYDALDDLSIKELERKLYSNDIFNLAADYEISNRGYTEADKDIVRNLGPYLHSTREIRGLVTEDDHPDWVNLPVEDMYDRLVAELEQARKDAEQKAQDPDIIDGILITSQAFYDPRDNVLYGSGVWGNISNMWSNI
jgi:hypothetical protein